MSHWVTSPSELFAEVSRGGVLAKKQLHRVSRAPSGTSNMKSVLKESGKPVPQFPQKMGLMPAVLCPAFVFR